MHRACSTQDMLLLFIYFTVSTSDVMNSGPKSIFVVSIRVLDGNLQPVQTPMEGCPVVDLKAYGSQFPDYTLTNSTRPISLVKLTAMAP